MLFCKTKKNELMTKQRGPAHMRISLNYLPSCQNFLEENLWSDPKASEILKH